MTCVVINLDKRPDRMEAFRAEFEREAAGHTLERFRARTSNIAHHSVVNGRIGCMLSHRGVIELARDRGWEYVVAFEDDATLVSDAGQRWIDAIDRLKKQPWWMLFLGQNTVGPVLKEDGDLYRVSRSLTTHAVVYHRRSYAALLKRLPATEAEALPFMARHKAIDLYYAYHIIPRMPTYCIWPHLAHQREDVSDILGTPTQRTPDDANTEKWIVDSPAAFRMHCTAWNLGRRPWHQVMERLRPLRKREFYAPAAAAVV